MQGATAPYVQQATVVPAPTPVMKAAKAGAKVVILTEHHHNCQTTSGQRARRGANSSTKNRSTTIWACHTSICGNSVRDHRPTPRSHWEIGEALSRTISPSSKKVAGAIYKPNFPTNRHGKAAKVSKPHTKQFHAAMELLGNLFKIARTATYDINM